MAALRPARRVERRTATHVRRVFRDLSLGQSTARCGGLRRGLRQWTLGRARSAARRRAALHRCKRRRSGRRAKESRGCGERELSRGCCRRHAFGRRQYGFWLQPWRPPPFARSRGRTGWLREEAQARSADARLYLLRLRQSPGVVSFAVACKRFFAPGGFEGTVSLEIGNRRTSRGLRLLAVGAGCTTVRAVRWQCHPLAARRLSLAQLLCHAHGCTRSLWHAHRASHDPSADQNADGECRAARDTFSRCRAILVRRWRKDLAGSWVLQNRSGPSLFGRWSRRQVEMLECLLVALI